MALNNSTKNLMLFSALSQQRNNTPKLDTKCTRVLLVSLDHNQVPIVPSSPVAVTTASRNQEVSISFYAKELKYDSSSSAIRSQ